MRRSVDVDTHEGYWGDDDLTRDGDTSECDPSSLAQSIHSRSDRRVAGAPMTPPALRIQRDFGHETPSRITSYSMPLISGQSTSSPPPPRPPQPNTPESRRLGIVQAFEAVRNLSTSTSPTSKKPIPQVTDLDMFDDLSEEHEVSMILTDTEPSQGSPTLSSSSTSRSFSFSSEESLFSSIGSWNRRDTTECRERKSVSPSKRNTIPGRTGTAPTSQIGVVSCTKALEISFTAPLPSRSELMPIIGKTFPMRIADIPLGDKLEAQYIAHDEVAQKLMDTMEISWGVQYELARGISLGLWSWGEVVPDRLARLVGSSGVSAYKVAHVMLGRPLSKNVNLALWQQLDKEQGAIMENMGRGLGLMGPWKGEPEWHGGRIQQRARLYVKNSEIHIKLEPMEMCKSHRFARYCGSRRILQVRVPDDVGRQDEVRNFLCSKFIICGRVFVPFHAKEGSVYMVEINDDSHRPPRVECGDQFRLSLSQFVNWHNPLALNKSQPISKYASRFGLGLSNSVPVIEFQTDCIELIDDEIAAGWDKTKKPPSEKVLTDGCGFINRAAMMEITRKMKYGTRPTAVQARICGAKGLWILDPGFNQDHRPRIWIRDSQNKIKYPNFDDRSRRILDLLCVSQPPTSISLSEQSILNLHFNGVPETTLIELLERGIQDEVTPLMDWSMPMPYLWDAINKAGSVTRVRAARYAAGRGRALGLTQQDWGPDWLNNNDVLSEEQAISEVDSMEIDGDSTSGEHAGRNRFSGAPLSIHESAVELVQSGFIPTELSVLREKIRRIVELIIKSTIEKCHVPLQQSISALVVPDPLGILEEGQIYCHSSVGIMDPETATTFNVLKGEVLIGRYPVRLASDIQKVTAMEVMELSDWTDVIIVSTRGERSAANILAGGDYDGDELFIIREPCLVKPFESKPLIPEPPNLQEESFDVSAESVEQFSRRSLSNEDMQRPFQRKLLSGLNDAKVGLYSRFHQYAIFKYGYDHEETNRMAYMFSITLDSGKTGLRLKDDVFKKHRKFFDFAVPDANDFILNRLVAAGKAKGDELLQQYDNVRSRDDLADLKKPWDEALWKAKKFDKAYKGAACQAEMQKISKHVDEVFQEWCHEVGKAGKARQREGETRQTKRQRREDPMLKVASKFHQKLDVDNVFDDTEILKASYACNKGVTFALSIAFNLVCQIKAKASPHGCAPCTRIFDEMKSIGRFSMRALLPLDKDSF